MSKSIIITFFVCSICVISRTDLDNVKPWAYQLQNIDIKEIENLKGIKLIVMDYSSDGTNANKFNINEITRIKQSGKYAIAYISIGEAENYRYYWKTEWDSKPPEWLGPENPNWKGNYKVKFWMKEWQNIVFSYIDTIISQGFDGIYLDIIDAWYYWVYENPEKPDADSLMCRFVVNIRNYVDKEKANDDFIIIPQNGEDVIFGDNIITSLRIEYLNAIDAIGIEDVLFTGDGDENNNFNPDNYRLNIIENYKIANKKIYSIEYLTEEPKISQYLTEAKKREFMPYACIRTLDKLCNPIATGITDDNLVEKKRNMINYLNEPYIYYELRTPNTVRIDIFNSLGVKIATLVDEWQEAGWHNEELRMNNEKLPAGMYFYRIQIGNRIESWKMIKL